METISIIVMTAIIIFSSILLFSFATRTQKNEKQAPKSSSYEAKTLITEIPLEKPKRRPYKKRAKKRKPTTSSEAVVKRPVGRPRKTA